MRDYTLSWRLREAVRARTPQSALAAYRRWLTPRLTDNKAHVEFSGWAAKGHRLREEFGTARVSFEPDGVWILDEQGVEWSYDPDSWLSALGKEVGRPHEHAELDHVRSALRPDGTFVDLGAHVGGYSIPIALMSPQVEIHAFEPVPSTRARLERNLGRNHLEDRVNVWPFALGDVAGRSQISVADGVANRLAGRGSAGPGAVDVEVATVDDVLLDRVDRVDVIKCDVEGGELPALRGTEQILRRDHPDLIVEIDRRYTPRFGYRPEDLVSWLGDLGYSWERFVGDRRLPPVKLEQALDEGNNFLFTAR